MYSGPPGPSDSVRSLGRTALLFGLVLLFGGCGPTSFLGQQYTNFTAYYNTFHNANEAFDQGVESIEERDVDIDRMQYVSLFRGPNDGVDESAFEKAVQKSADVLREHPESKWVDDALLLIGKSYFYLENYAGAEEKFREVISIGGQRAEEAHFWLARTLVSTQQFGEAAEELRTGIQETPAGEWRARLYLVQGELHVRQEEWQEAVQALNRGLQEDLPDPTAARAAFLLGQVLETIGNPSAARVAYRQVQEYNPSYSLDFAAQLSEIELQGVHVNASQALDRLSDLEGNDKNYERRGEMALVRARIYQAQDQRDRARRTLRDALYGEEALQGGLQGHLHYDLARLYRDAYEDFDRAAAHFDTARTSLASSPGGRQDAGPTQRLPKAPVDVEVQADRYRELAERSRKVTRLDSLLRIGRMSDREFQTFVRELRRRQEADQATREHEGRDQAARQFRGRGEELAEERQQAAPAADTRESSAGFLFYKEEARLQEGRRRFEQTWGDRPRVDNWRRRSAIRTMRAASSESTSTREGGAAEAEGPPVPQEGEDQVGRSTEAPSALDLSEIPRDSSSRAEMEADRAVARYELANSLFLAASRPDSAATWYRRVLQENGDHPVARRALYALAEAYRAQGDTTAARQSYRRLLEQYPDTDLAEQARRRLGEQETQTENRSVLADTAYARAYAAWQYGEMEDALAQFLETASRYPDSDAAPRALLAAGIVYWRQIQEDSTRGSRLALERQLHELRTVDSTEVESSPFLPGSSIDSVYASLSDSSGTDPDSVPAQREEGKDSARVAATDGRAGASELQGDADSSRADEGLAAPEENVPAPDSTWGEAAVSVVPDAYAPLDTLLTYLTERYPEAPQVQRARTILDVVQERRGVTDSASTDRIAEERAVADSVATDTTMAERRSDAPDSSRAETEESAEGDARETSEEDRTVLPAPSAPRSVDDSAAPEDEVDLAQGEWTLRVQTVSSSEEASNRVEEIRRQLKDQWPVGIEEETVDGETQYHLVVGTFSTERAAARARGRVASGDIGQPEVWTPPEDRQ